MRPVPESQSSERNDPAPSGAPSRQADTPMRLIGEVAGVLVLACALFALAGGLGMLFWWLVVFFSRGI